MSEQKILVVDDEKHIRMLYQEELEAAWSWWPHPRPTCARPHG